MSKQSSKRKAMEMVNSHSLRRLSTPSAPEKQWKWSIVIPYDVYKQQVPRKLPKNAVPSS